MEILNYGIGGRTYEATRLRRSDANAIVRLQRLHDNSGRTGGGCNYSTDVTGAKIRRTGGRTCCSTRAKRCSATTTTRAAT